MTGKISPFLDRKQIEQEALDWLILLDGDQPPTTDELAKLEEWLGRSPVHRNELNNLNAFWSNQVLTELSVPLGRHEAERSMSDSEIGDATVRRNRRPVFAAAAVLMLTAGLSMVAWWMQTGFTSTNGVYMTAVGQQLTGQLADGSVVHLNTNSQIEVDYGNGYRNIRLLQGEVHFEVAKNPDKPFRVYAGQGRVEAVGTAFTVQLKDHQLIDVLVTEGKVEVASLDSGSQIPDSIQLPVEAFQQDQYAKSRSVALGYLKAGEAASVKTESQLKLVLAGDAGALKKIAQEIPEEEIARRQSWQQGLLVFNGESLAEVVAEISRFTSISIEIVDPELKGIQIGGRFRVGEIEEMFGSLEANFSLKVERVGYNRVVLMAAK